MMEICQIQLILEAALLAAEEPLTIQKFQQLFADDLDKPTALDIENALTALKLACEERSYELKELAGSSYCLRVKQQFSPWVAKLWEERTPRYSRALLETLALIAYRQPITRAEIEQVRGVSINTNVIRTLTERGWIRVVGHKDVPGKPSLFATTKDFLDYFQLKSLEELPSLDKVINLEIAETKLIEQLQTEIPALVEYES